MSRYARIDTLVNRSFRYVQSADPSDLTQQVSAAFAAAVSANPNNRLAMMNLAGAGDGHSFMCFMEFAPLADLTLVGPVIDPAAAGVAFYMASNPIEILTARGRAESFFGPLIIHDELLAGASQGLRYMGAFIFE